MATKITNKGSSTINVPSAIGGGTITSGNSKVVTYSMQEVGAAMAAASITKYSMTQQVMDAPISIYVNASHGSDENNGTSASPYLTLYKALSSLPLGWTETCRITLTEGTYVFPAGDISFGEPVGPGASPLVFVGATTLLKTLTATSAGSTTVITDSGAGMTINQYIGAAVTCLTGANAGQRGMARRNTATTVELNGAFLSAIGSGDTFSIERPSVEFTFAGAATFFRSGFGFKDVKITGNPDYVMCNIPAAQNVEFNLTGSSNFLGGGVAAFSGGNITRAWNADPINPFPLASTNCGVYMHGTGSQTFSFSASTLRVGLVVTLDMTLNLDMAANCRFNGLGTNGGALTVTNNSVFNQGPGVISVGAGSCSGTNITFTQSRGTFNNCVITNCTTTAVKLVDGSFVRLDNVSGSTGNLAYGISVQSMSQVVLNSTTLTGSSGDTLVGVAAKAYGELPYTDGYTLNRIQ